MCICMCVCVCVSVCIYVDNLFISFIINYESRLIINRTKPTGVFPMEFPLDFPLGISEVNSHRP